MALILAQNPLGADRSEGGYPQDEWPLPNLKFAPQDGLRFSHGGGAGPLGFARGRLFAPRGKPCWSIRCVAGAPLWMTGALEKAKDHRRTGLCILG